MIVERKKASLVPFGSLNPGDCFEDDSGVYIKMFPIHDYDMEGEHIRNCFWFDQCHVCRFRDEAEVTPLNMKLVEI